MKLCTFSITTSLAEWRRIGVETSVGVVDASAARVAFLERSMPPVAALRVGSAQVPADMIELLGTGKVGMQWVAEAVDDVILRGQSASAGGQTTVYRLQDIKLLAPVPR